MTSSILVIAMLAASPKPVAIFVGPMPRNGFVDADKAVLDSVKDLQKELGKNRAFAVVPTEAGATLRLYVVSRGMVPTGSSTEYGTASGTVMGSYGQGTASSVSVPNMMARLDALLRVGDYERPFVGQSELSWSRCAGGIVKQLSSWVEANRAQLEKTTK
jgi:hypothetical protein